MQNQQKESNGVEQNQMNLIKRMLNEEPTGDCCVLSNDPEPALLDVFNELMS